MQKTKKKPQLPFPFPGMKASLVVAECSPWATLDVSDFLGGYYLDKKIDKNLKVVTLNNLLPGSPRGECQWVILGQVCCALTIRS